MVVLTLFDLVYLFYLWAQGNGLLTEPRSASRNDSWDTLIGPPNRTTHCKLGLPLYLSTATCLDISVLRDYCLWYVLYDKTLHFITIIQGGLDVPSSVFCTENTWLAIFWYLAKSLQNRHWLSWKKLLQLWDQCGFELRAQHINTLYCSYSQSPPYPCTCQKTHPGIPLLFTYIVWYY